MKKTFEITGVIQNYEGSRWMMKPEISPLPSKEKRYTNTTRVSEFDFRMFKEDIQNGESVGKSFEKRIRNKYAGKRL